MAFRCLHSRRRCQGPHGCGSINSKERYAAGERGPAVGTWREIGGASKPRQNEKPAFDLAKYKKPPAQTGPPQQGAYPQGEVFLLPSAETALDAAKDFTARARPRCAERLR